MQDHNVHEVEDFKGNLNYEQLLARAIDRCLYFRVAAPYSEYFQSVSALALSLVDMPSKSMRSDLNTFIEEKQYERVLGFMPTNRTEALVDYDIIFQEITRILQKHHMLFRSQIVETNV